MSESVTVIKDSLTQDLHDAFCGREIAGEGSTRTVPMKLIGDAVCEIFRLRYLLAEHGIADNGVATKSASAVVQ